MNRYIVTFGWIILGILVFFGSIKEQVVLDFEVRRNISMLFPQGWSFFTKSPRDEALMIYRIVDGKAEVMPMNNHQNAGFAFSRTTRLIGYESSMMASKVPPSRWNTYKDQPINTFISDTVLVLEQAKGYNHMVEGEYIFKLFKGVPFAWAGQQQAENNPFKITRISIQ